MLSNIVITRIQMTVLLENINQFINTLEIYEGFYFENFKNIQAFSKIFFRNT